MTQLDPNQANARLLVEGMRTHWQSIVTTEQNSPVSSNMQPRKPGFVYSFDGKRSKRVSRAPPPSMLLPAERMQAAPIASAAVIANGGGANSGGASAGGVGCAVVKTKNKQSKHVQNNQPFRTRSLCRFAQLEGDRSLVPETPLSISRMSGPKVTLDDIICTGSPTANQCPSNALQARRRRALLLMVGQAPEAHLSVRSEQVNQSGRKSDGVW